MISIRKGYNLLLLSSATMIEIATLVLAEEKFDFGEVEVALKLANLAKNISNCPNLDKYRAAYKVHLASITKN